MLGKARKGAAYVANVPWSTVDELVDHVPAKLRRANAERKAAAAGGESAR